MKLIQSKSLNKIIIFLSIFDLILTLYLFFGTSLLKVNLVQAKVTTISEDFYKEYSSYRLEKISRGLIDTMTTEEKVGQIFMLSVSGTSLNLETSTLLEKYGIGGVALLGNNIQNKSQLSQFTKQINDKSEIDPFIAIDQENAYVYRIPWDPTLSAQITEETMGVRSGVLKEAGVNMNLAPVLDLPLIQNSFMNGRFIGSLPPEVEEKGRAFLAGHNKNSVLTSLKHFPGHGRTTTDSHISLPVIQISRDELMQTELEPFKELINASAPVVMTGHLLFPEIDSEAASLSKVFQTDILRGELGFEGMIISDDMNMGSVRNDKDKFMKALKAGTNMIIYVQYFPEQIEELDALIELYSSDSELKEKIDASVALILKLKCEYKVLEECK